MAWQALTSQIEQVMTCYLTLPCVGKQHIVIRLSAGLRTALDLGAHLQQILHDAHYSAVEHIVWEDSRASQARQIGD